MRRVLVPLDGTDHALSILPDAQRLAGPDGTLILIRATQGKEYDRQSHQRSEWYALNNAQEYLEAQAEPLRAEGVNVEYHALYLGAAAESIDEAVKMYKADMIAYATHGRSPLGRLLRGGVAWKALAHSPVPVLLRHPEDKPEEVVQPGSRHIMVPLDGSDYAEQALPLAQQLATEWQASLWLAQSVPQDVLTGASDVTVTPDDLRVEIQDAYQYLNQVASRQGGEVHMGVFTGRTEVALEGAVGSWAITDIVMASHGRTGLSRVILGSVADALIHQLHCPIIVIPALAAKAVEQGESRIGVPA